MTERIDSMTELEDWLIKHDVIVHARCPKGGPWGYGHVPCIKFLQGWTCIGCTAIVPREVIDVALLAGNVKGQVDLGDGMDHEGLWIDDDGPIVSVCCKK